MTTLNITIENEGIYFCQSESVEFYLIQSEEGGFELGNEMWDTEALSAEPDWETLKKQAIEQVEAGDFQEPAEDLDD
ncbi:hypothetical protein [Deinococcus misasensis]|uniref:hypothetical protein n=1 Tax=Deinococcus misasensis TaxID=392413 RepID=UPI00054D1300|nr:hypothetical protein [Deinococcus misasensis]